MAVRVLQQNCMPAKGSQWFQFYKANNRWNPVWTKATESTSALMFNYTLMTVEINKIISHLKITHNLHSKQKGLFFLNSPFCTHLTKTMYKNTYNWGNVSWKLVCSQNGIFTFNYQITEHWREFYFFFFNCLGFVAVIINWQKQFTLSQMKRLYHIEICDREFKNGINICENKIPCLRCGNHQANVSVLWTQPCYTAHNGSEKTHVHEIWPDKWLSTVI